MTLTPAKGTVEIPISGGEKKATIEFLEVMLAVRGHSQPPPLILIHGFLDSYYSWHNIVEALTGESMSAISDDKHPASKRQRLIAISLRGWGESDKKGRYSVEAYAGDIIALMDQMNIQTAILGGHSMGSIVATLLAAKLPERVAGIALFGASCKLNPKVVADPATGTTLGDLGKTFASWSGGGSSSSSSSSSSSIATNTDVKSFLEKIQLPGMQPFVESGDITQEFANQIMAETTKGDFPRVFSEAWADLEVEDHTAIIPDIRCPVLIVVGDEDIKFPRSEQGVLMSLLTGSTSVSLRSVGPKASHNAIWTHARYIAQHLLLWMLQEVHQ